ncbi:MAG: TonB-dependent siderophore receptor [Phenylobacterium sp.]|nr:TonB-dependent siderophore receptor [Phenylobacterium sp.]
MSNDLGAVMKMTAQPMGRRILLGGVAMIVLAGAAGAAAAQGAASPQGAPPAQGADTVGELVVTAPNYVPTTTTGSKVATSILETPQSITVINRDQIDVLHWTSLQQVVRYTAGVTGENFGPDARYDWLTLRGFAPVQYIDGLQAPIGSVTNVGTDLYGFQSVEILKGPSSGLYGSTPPGGIVNMTSRRPQQEASGELVAEVGNYDLKQIQGDGTGPLSDTVSYRLTGLYRDSGSIIDFEKDRRGFLSSALKWDIDPTTSLTLLGYYQNDDLKNNSGGFLPPSGTVLPNPNGTIPRSRSLAEPGYNMFQRDQYGVGYEFRHAFSDNLSFEQNLKYFSSDTKTLSVYGAGLQTPNGSIVNRYNFPFNEKVTSFNVDNRVQADLATGDFKHTLLVGLDYRRYVDTSEFGFAVAPPIDVFHPVYGAPVTVPTLYPYANMVQTQTGLYVQDQVRRGGFILTLGARQDWVRTDDKAGGTTADDSQLSYRIGANYVFANGVAPYVSYAKSFQPTTGVAFNGATFAPTQGEQWEAGIKVEPAGLPPGVKTLVTLAAYDLVQRNVLTPDPDPTHPFASVQTGEVQVKGVELEGVARIRERLSLNASYSYTDSEVTKSNGPDLGMQLPMVPHHKVSAFADYTFQDGLLAGFGVGLGARYLSSSYGDAANLWQASSVILWDAVAHYNFKAWKLTLSGSNIFDKTYVAACESGSNCFYGTARSVTFSLGRSF